MESHFTVSACDIEVAQMLDHEVRLSRRWALPNECPGLRDPRRGRLKAPAPSRSQPHAQLTARV